MSARRTPHGPVACVSTALALLSVAACSPPATPRGDASVSDAASDVVSNDLGADASLTPLTDLRTVAGALPRCNRATQDCVTACATPTCVNACLNTDGRDGTVIDNQFLTCPNCYTRQQRVCAASHGCAEQTRAFVACVTACGSDSFCVDRDCPTVRDAYIECRDRGPAAGLCGSSLTDPGMRACFATSDPDAGVDAGPDANADARPDTAPACEGVLSTAQSVDLARGVTTGPRPDTWLWVTTTARSGITTVNGLDFRGCDSRPPRIVGRCVADPCMATSSVTADHGTVRVRLGDDSTTTVPYDRDGYYLPVNFVTGALWNVAAGTNALIEISGDGAGNGRSMSAQLAPPTPITRLGTRWTLPSSGGFTVPLVVSPPCGTVQLHFASADRARRFACYLPAGETEPTLTPEELAEVRALGPDAQVAVVSGTARLVDSAGGRRMLVEFANSAAPLVTIGDSMPLDGGAGDAGADAGAEAGPDAGADAAPDASAIGCTPEPYNDSPIRLSNAGYSAYDVFFSPDGLRLAIDYVGDSDAGHGFYNLCGTIERSFYAGDATLLGYGPDGATAYLIAPDPADPSMRVAMRSTGTALPEVTSDVTVDTVHIARGGRFYLRRAGSTLEVRAFGATGGTELPASMPIGRYDTLRVSPDGNAVLHGYGFDRSLGIEVSTRTAGGTFGPWQRVDVPVRAGTGNGVPVDWARTPGWIRVTLDPPEPFMPTYAWDVNVAVPSMRRMVAPWAEAANIIRVSDAGPFFAIRTNGGGWKLFREL